MGVLQTGCLSHVAAETVSWWLRLCCLRVSPVVTPDVQDTVHVCVCVCVWVRIYLNPWTGMLLFIHLPSYLLWFWHIDVHVVCVRVLWEYVLKFNEVFHFLLLKHPAASSAHQKQSVRGACVQTLCVYVLYMCTVMCFKYLCVTWFWQSYLATFALLESRFG